MPSSVVDWGRNPKPKSRQDKTKKHRKHKIVVPPTTDRIRRKKVTRTSPSKTVDSIPTPVIRAVKFKNVEVPKIKALPVHSSEMDFSAQAKKESAKQPIIIQNYMYPQGEQSAVKQQDYQLRTASQLPTRSSSDGHWLRQSTPTITTSSREFMNYPIPAKESEPYPYSFFPSSRDEGSGGGGGTWKDVEGPTTVSSRMLSQLQERGAPYTTEEAKIVFGLDLRKKTDKELLSGLREQGVVI